MNTPILDFVQRYADSSAARFHMPGHKGRTFLGCEALDITEISGAGDLYDFDDMEQKNRQNTIITASERNAAALFGAEKTFYVTEGSSQCIRAMIYLAIVHRPVGTKPIIVAGRNAHKSFLYAAALVDAEIIWLWSETRTSLCRCSISTEQLRQTLSALSSPPAAVYITSPDYLGGQEEIAPLASVCHAYHTPLLVDNAHGAYLHFLPNKTHPLDLGVDMCCDSAHKTLPVLTGGAYLHINQIEPTEDMEKDRHANFIKDARAALALFGSTSPSWLTLISLDLCNQYLSENYAQRLFNTVSHLEKLREKLRKQGWQVEESDPLRLTLRGNTDIMMERLHRNNIEWEYADKDFLVFMISPENTEEEVEGIAAALQICDVPAPSSLLLPTGKTEAVMTAREALFAPHERIPIEKALDRICAAPIVGCPPAIPIVVSGERINREILSLFSYYNIQVVDVLTLHQS